MVSKTQIFVFLVLFLAINAFILQYSINIIDSAYWSRIDSTYWSQEIIDNPEYVYPVFTTNNWELIDNNTTNDMCHYSPYVYNKKKEKENSMTFSMCLRGKNNHISDYIRKHGSWMDCNPLLPIYDNLLKFLNNSNQKKYFLDVGGNIGACSFTMTSNYDYLSIFAFEPVTSNRFYFKNTMITNNFHNIKLIECAVGSDVGNKTIYSFDRNMGDSRIAINSSQLEKHLGSYHSEIICLTTIDTVMENEDGIIPLIKMDTQGYEYFALKGAQNLFANSKFSPLVIKTEFAPWLIRNTNSTPINVLNLMDKYGYDIYKTYNATNNECIQCPFQNLIHPSSFQEFAESFRERQFTDIYALKKVLY